MLVAHPSFAVYGNTESEMDPSVFKIDETKYLGTPIKKDFRLLDETGREFVLGDVMGKPLILLFSYYTCDGACQTANQALALQLAQVTRFTAGQDYRVLTVSFDKADTIKSLQTFAERLNVTGSLRQGWRHAILKHESDIKTLTESVGIKYFWSYRDDLFMHPNVLLFVSPKGRVVRYLYNYISAPKDIELAIIDANWDKIVNSSRIIDILAGVCYSYNFQEGRYTFNIPLLVGMGSLLFGISTIVIAFRVARKKIIRRTEYVKTT